MKRNKFKRKLAILLVFVLVFAGLGTSAFAARPPKTPKLEIGESSLVVLSGDTVSTELIVSNPGVEEPIAKPVIVSAPLRGEAIISIISDKRNVDKYEFTYTDLNEYPSGGTENIEIALSTDLSSTQMISITIQGSSVNQPPVLVSAPDITGSFETGTEATPVFGVWRDDDSTSFTVVRTWELDGTTLIQNPDDGPLLLDSTWDGKYLVLKEVATDSDGEFSEKSSEAYLITTPAPPPPPPEDLLYVALGDSIITGTVAPSLPDETPFIYGFKVHLEDKTKRPVTMKNFGVDGDQTGHLLARLGGPEYDGVTADQTMIDNVKAAEVISVSIAGNNLMSAAKYTTYVFFFIKVTYYDFNNINPDKAEAGRAAVEIDFPKIIQQIRSHNPTAKIIVTDTYNPFNKTTDVGTEDEGNYDLVEYYLHRNGIGVNDVIRRVCSENSNVECAEVYSAFEAYGAGNKKEDITYMYITDTYYGFELRNPHPNNIGQGLIETAAENAYDRIH